MAGSKKEFTPEHVGALEEISKIVNRLGFSSNELAEARQLLSKYMPKEVFLDKFGNDRGWSLLYALYAPQIVNDFYQNEKRAGEKRQKPKHRRRMYQELAGDAMDYVQDVFMGNHNEHSRFRGGVRSVAVPSTENQPNKFVYDPTQRGQRPSICPHCNVSFWPMSAGNGDPQYEIVDGRPLPEWRDDESQAPEHIRFNPKSGERQESSGYSYCGGRHQIFDVTDMGGGVDVERAEQLSGLGWDQLRSQNRIRNVVSKESGPR